MDAARFATMSDAEQDRVLATLSPEAAVALWRGLKALEASGLRGTDDLGSWLSKAIKKVASKVSTVLPYAAPLLSFIPGVGPILSTAASSAANFLLPPPSPTSPYPASPSAQRSSPVLIFAAIALLVLLASKKR